MVKVIGKDLEKNILYVGQGFENEYVYADEAHVSNVNWIPTEKFKGVFKCTAKFRYRQPDVPVELEWMEGELLRVRLLDPVRAVTPGQAAVFYLGDVCLGGGRIEAAFKDGERRMY